MCQHRPVLYCFMYPVHTALPATRKPNHARNTKKNKKNHEDAVRTVYTYVRQHTRACTSLVLLSPEWRSGIRSRFESTFWGSGRLAARGGTTPFPTRSLLRWSEIAQTPAHAWMARGGNSRQGMRKADVIATLLASEMESARTCSCTRMDATRRGYSSRYTQSYEHCYSPTVSSTHGNASRGRTLDTSAPSQQKCGRNVNAKVLIFSRGITART